MSHLKATYRSIIGTWHKHLAIFTSPCGAFCTGGLHIGYRSVQHMNKLSSLSWIIEEGQCTELEGSRSHCSRCRGYSGCIAIYESTVLTASTRANLRGRSALAS